MATCEMCGNDYDKAFTVTMAGHQHTFDSFECAINALAPTCNHCGCRLTDRDITVRAVSDGHDPRRDRVRDAMTPQVFYCFEDQEVTEAARLMREKQVRRLPVLNRDKRLAGIVSLGDLAIQTGDEPLA